VKIGPLKQETDARRTTAAEMKCMRKTAGYAWTDYKTNTDTAKEPNIAPDLDKIQNKLVATYKHNAPY